MKMSICLEEFLLWVNILPCQIVVRKVSVDRVCIGPTSVCGYHFPWKIKILWIELLKFFFKWLIMFSLKIISHRRGPMENTSQ